MKTIKTILFCLCAVLFTSANAQWQPTGNLTVFSDNGKKFYLILNGEKYNDIAETNVRIEELQNPYYSCKIIFADSSVPAISKNMVTVTDPATGAYQDITYRIKENSKGKYSMMIYSAIPAQQNMVRPAGASVYRFGSPRQHYNYNAVPATTVVTQPTQTVVVTQPAPTMSVNAPGVNVNVTIPTIPSTSTVITSPAPPHHNHHRHDNRNDRRNNLIPVGASVTVNWKGSWYPAKILDVNARTYEYYIKYDGWSDSWNEWVGEDRIKGGNRR